MEIKRVTENMVFPGSSIFFFFFLDRSEILKGGWVGPSVSKGIFTQSYLWRPQVACHLRHLWLKNYVRPLQRHKWFKFVSYHLIDAQPFCYFLPLFLCAFLHDFASDNR